MRQLGEALMPTGLFCTMSESVSVLATPSLMPASVGAALPFPLAEHEMTMQPKPAEMPMLLLPATVELLTPE